MAQFVSEMRHEGREDIDSKRLRLFCVASSDQARKMKLTRKMSSGSIGLRIGDIMGALAYVGNVPVVSLLPGGEFVPEANRFVESLSTARKFTSAITDEFRDLEVEDGICRLLNTLQVVQLDLTVDDYVLLIFALLRVSLDKSMGKHSTLIISVIERVFEVATSADKMGEVADLLKSVLPSVAYSLLSLAKMIHSLSLVDNHSIDDLLVESVVAILINRSERAELIDCKSQLEAFTEAFLSLYPKDDFVSDRSNVWALILLMNAGIRPKVSSYAVCLYDLFTIQKVLFCAGVYVHEQKFKISIGNRNSRLGNIRLVRGELSKFWSVASAQWEYRRQTHRYFCQCCAPTLPLPQVSGKMPS